ncbi:unnamed protein product [Ectocarpus sp. 13 AM-2016]
MSMSADLVSACRMLLAAHLQNEGRPLNIEWTIVIDNSGSMVRVADECLQTVVILIEALRRLECRFAVATLGDANRTRILKSLAGHFNMSVGEQIIAGFTYDESSHIATGVAAVADHVFARSRGDAEPHERRVMILVTDGLSQELAEKNFGDIRQKHDMELAVLHTQYGGGTYNAQYAKMLRTITNGLYFPVTLSANVPSTDQENENTVVSIVLSKMVVQVLGYILKPGYVHTRQPQIDGSADIERSGNNVRRPTVEDLQEELTHGIYPLRVACTDIRRALTEGSATRPADMYKSSSPEASITMIEKLEGLLGTQDIPRRNRSHSAGNNVFQDIAPSDIVANITEVTGQMGQKEQAKCGEVMRSWNKAAQGLQDVTRSIVSVLEDHILPHNKFTRRQAAFKGSQLHLPALIKAVATDFNYQKFFSTRTAGGQREYGIVLALDISQSMDGHLLSSALEAFVVLVQGFNEVDVDFTVILFGENVQVIKVEGQQWDAACVLSLLCRLNTMKQNCTRDAEAIGLAKHLLPAQGPRKIFVMTDGFTSYGLQLAEVLINCESDGIEVVAVSVGMDTSNVHRMYPRWVTAAVPAALPDALRQLYEREATGGGESGRATGGAEPYDKGETDMWKAVRIIAANGIDNDKMKEVLADRWDRFRSLQDQLRGEKDMKLVTTDGPGKVTVDIAFVIDSTGSMAPVVNSVRAHMFMILNGNEGHSIVSKVKEEYPDLELEIRCASLLFKDFNDAAQFSESRFDDGKHFTENTDYFLESTRNNFRATGGDDQAEDIAGALRKATEWKDWSGQARFLLLFTDAPCHGSDFSAGFTDDHADQSDASKVGFHAAFAAAIKNKISILHCECYREATERTHQGMQQALDLAIREAKSAAPTSRGGLHIVFVLDESGSMSGSPWHELERAYNGFLDKRVIDQGHDDTISVVQFGTSARVTCQASPIDMAPRSLSRQGGGTCFAGAMVSARAILERDNASRRAQLVFMSDGAAGDAPEAARTMSNIVNEHPNIGVEVVAFGGGADGMALGLIANAGRTRVTTAGAGSLTQTFFDIASGASVASEELYREICKRIAEEVSTQLMLEYL